MSITGPRPPHTAVAHVLMSVFFTVVSDSEGGRKDAFKGDILSGFCTLYVDWLRFELLICVVGRTKIRMKGVFSFDF